LGFTWGQGPQGFIFWIQTGENKSKEKRKKKVKTGSKEAEEQEVQQQKHMTEEKKK